MNYITINAGSAKYISEIAELKDGYPNGILNKKQTNVGGTHSCIVSDTPYIISVPSVTLIKNKCNQNAGLFGVYEGVTFEDFAEYILGGGIKIMVTYDSTAKVSKWLTLLGKDPYTTFNVLVDEYHKLLSDYSYRDTAISSLLAETTKYQHVTYMSATPIDEDFVPEQLAGLPHYTIEWPSVKVKVIRRKTNKPFVAAVNIINKYKASGYSLKVGDNVSNEAYFFVNSVTAIKDICDNAGLAPSDVKVVCADNPYNKEILDGYQISTPEAPNKPITFVTSLAFLGCDFYSESGIIFIITSTGKRNTLLDISTDIAQIAGRIRTATNPFKGTIYHIYNTRMSDLTADEYEEMLQADIKDSESIIATLNNLDEAGRLAFLKRLKIDEDMSLFYFNNTTRKFDFDTLKLNNLRFRFKVAHLLYNDGIAIREAYMKAGMDVTMKQSYNNYEDEFIESATRASWNDTLKDYAEARFNGDEDAAEYFASFERDFKKIYDTLGYDKLKALKFRKSDVENALYDNAETTENAVCVAIMKAYKSGEFVSAKDLKEFFKETYAKLRITKTAKATDILDYFPQSNQARPVIDGNRVKGYTINYKLVTF